MPEGDGCIAVRIGVALLGTITVSIYRSSSDSLSSSSTDIVNLADRVPSVVGTTDDDDSSSESDELLSLSESDPERISRTGDGTDRGGGAGRRNTLFGGSESELERGSCAGDGIDRDGGAGRRSNRPGGGGREGSGALEVIQACDFLCRYMVASGREFVGRD
jgi:hypothetical protein